MRVEKERTKKKKIKKKRVKDEEGKGSGKKNTKAKSPMKRETESLVWERLFLQLCERLGGAAHQQNFWLFNLSTVMYK